MATERMMFDFLDDLKKSGTVNMFLAWPYLMKAFDMPPGRAREVLSDWMRKESK